MANPQRKIRRRSGPDERSARAASDGAASSDRVGLPATGRIAKWGRSPFAFSAASGLLLWAALPPLGFWPLAWVAPVFWLRLITAGELSARRPYLQIWLASVLYWGLVMQGIRLAHWANYIGLVALSCYLGIYLPIFIALARTALHRWKLPLLLVAPVTWTGVELMRGYGPLGFSMALLAHTQVGQLAVIQISDIFGAYAVSFLLMFSAAAILTMLPDDRGRWRVWPALPLAAIIGATLIYGRFRLNQAVPIDDLLRPARIALVQGSIDTIFEDNPHRPRQIYEQYSELTDQACRAYGSLDLIVWPETMFPVNDVIVEENAFVRFDATIDRATMEEHARAFPLLVRVGIQRINDSGDKPADSNESDRSGTTSWMLGATTWQLGDHLPYRYNAAIMVNPQAEVTGRYYKMRPVMFGEYVPFGETFPGLYALFPLPNGLTCGTEPLAVTVGGLTLSPSICFESTMPHLIRSHVARLTRRGEPPDVLINLTNDGWFWGSSILDMQLDCAVFRAVELRRPFLVAANTGFSAWIDGNGSVQQKGPRRATGTILAEVRADGRNSLYAWWGDLPAGLCVVCCLIVAAVGLLRGLRRRMTGTPATI